VALVIAAISTLVAQLSRRRPPWVFACVEFLTAAEAAYVQLQAVEVEVGLAAPRAGQIDLLI
jgi:uncharacterized Fe-S cluster-containing MiaB family protein